jgi:hypothetical protein
VKQGQSASESVKYDDDVAPYLTFINVRDIVALAYAPRYTWVVTAVGHDFGSPVAGFCGLFRPDLFRSLVCMRAVPTRSREASYSYFQRGVA